MKGKTHKVGSMPLAFNDTRGVEAALESWSANVGLLPSRSAGFDTDNNAVRALHPMAVGTTNVFILSRYRLGCFNQSLPYGSVIHPRWCSMRFVDTPSLLFPERLIDGLLCTFASRAEQGAIVTHRGS